MRKSKKPVIFTSDSPTVHGDNSNEEYLDIVWAFYEFLLNVIHVIVKLELHIQLIKAMNVLNVLEKLHMDINKKGAKRPFFITICVCTPALNTVFDTCNATLRFYIFYAAE
jgi:hypothetical protein